jgi:hypothetical protein
MDLGEQTFCFPATASMQRARLTFATLAPPPCRADLKGLSSLDELAAPSLSPQWKAAKNNQVDLVGFNWSRLVAGRNAACL